VVTSGAIAVAAASAAAAVTVAASVALFVVSAIAVHLTGPAFPPPSD
jgi:hypothetical protein